MEDERILSNDLFNDETQNITKQLTVDDSEHLLSLFGINDENLELIKKELDINIYAHGADITLSGYYKNVETAYLTLLKLLEIIKKGDSIDKTRIR